MPQSVPLIMRGCIAARSNSIDFLKLQRRCVQACVFAQAGLALYNQDIEALRGFSEAVLGDSAQYPALSKALVESHLRGWRDWRNADVPLLWIGKVAHRVMETEKQQDDPNLNAIELDEAAETPNAAVETRAFSSRSLMELERAALADSDVQQYVSLRAKGNRPGAIRRQLGWDLKKAEQVRGRYRRIKDRLRDLGAGMETRWSVPPGAISDASYTVYRELLFDGSKGTSGSIWQHRQTEDDEK